MLVMGDAIAVSLLNRRDFTRDDFAKVHPKGQLGRRLLLKVADIMHTGSAIPKVMSGTPLIQTLFEISQKRLGMAIITDKDQYLLGVFTDGDLRRAIDQGLNLKTTLVDQVMTSHCKTINKEQLAAEALEKMEASR